MGYYLIISVCAYNFLQIVITTYDHRKTEKYYPYHQKQRQLQKDSSITVWIHGTNLNQRSQILSRFKC